MDTKELEVFIKVVEYRKLTDVAESSGLSQPAVSNLIRRLEKELGTPLFLRKGKSLFPTSQGKIFYAAAKNQLYLLNRAQSSMRHALTQKQELVIAVPVVSDSFFRMATAFSTEYPDIRIIFQSDKFVPEDHSLSSAEFILLHEHDLQNSDSLIIDYQKNLYAVMSKSHPLAKERIISLTRLRDESFVFLQQENGEYEQSYNDCIGAGFIPKINLIVNSWVAKYAAVRLNCGIGLAYDNELEMPGDIIDCATIPIRTFTSGGAVCLAWYNEKLSPAGSAFLEYARTYFKT